MNEAVEGSCRKVFKPWHLRQEAASGEPGAQLGAGGEPPAVAAAEQCRAKRATDARHRQAMPFTHSGSPIPRHLSFCLCARGGALTRSAALAPAFHPPLPDSEEDDPELLLHVPFNGSVKLTGITVVGGPDGASPAKLKASTAG